jgi:hypothetical protein
MSVSKGPKAIPACRSLRASPPLAASMTLYPASSSAVTVIPRTHHPLQLELLSPPQLPAFMIPTAELVHALTRSSTDMPMPTEVIERRPASPQVSWSVCFPSSLAIRHRSPISSLSTLAEQSGRFACGFARRTFRHSPQTSTNPSKGPHCCATCKLTCTHAYPRILP